MTSPGKPSEFASAFGDQAVATVKHHELRSTDRQLAAALGAGWYLAALCHGAGANRTAAAVRGSAMGFASFEQEPATAFSRDQVKASAAKLAEPVKNAGLTLPALDDLAPENAPQADNEMLGALSAADFRLGKAYGVGAALLQLTSRPADQPTLKEHITNTNVAPLVAAIDDLGTALAPHAGHSVRESIREWQKSIDTGSRVAPESPETWKLLERQGELWRAMLAGEKTGRDMLEIDDYVDAAERLAKRLRGLVLRLVVRVPEVTILVVALFALGIFLIVATDAEAAIIAGAGSILASLGLTWRGVGRSLGGLAGMLEQPLWGAELDTAITQAITLLEREKGRDVARERRGVMR
jgi:hypothetical protein